MPQVFIMIAPIAQAKLKGITLDAMGKALIKDVEEVFNIKGEEDVAFTALNLAHTIGEADVQVEIRYTAGEDEYGRGEPFDPPRAVKQKLVKKMGETLRKHLSGVVQNASIWPMPIKESEFSMIDMFPKGFEDIKSAPEEVSITVMWGKRKGSSEYGTAIRMGDRWYKQSDPNPLANGALCATPTAWCPKGGRA